MSMTNKKNLLISGESTDALNRVFESATAGKDKRYIFTGCFTQCSSKKPGGKIIMNRNKRIYYDDEVLRHLGYLRDQIKENGFLGGELDHPDRFEVKLAECSHKIVDLWYDQESQQIRGKLELLDTPKGMIARQLVDAGLKLAVSSRSAGSVRNDSSVALDMMYTWDIVLTPGFEEAHLNRVAESLKTESAKQFLNESFARHNIIENKDIIEVSKPAEINKKAQKAMKKDINIAELCRPIYEKEENDNTDVDAALPEANINPLEEDDAPAPDSDNKEEKKDAPKKDKDEKKDDSESSELTDEKKKERRKLIIGVESKTSDDNSELTDSEKEERRNKIIDVEGVENADNDKEEKKDEKQNNKDADKSEKSEDTNECEDTKDEDEDNLPSDIKTKNSKSTKEFKDKVLNDCDNKCKDVKEKTKSDMDNIKNLLDKAKKMKDVKESICRIYPFAISLSESNFAKFSALQTKDKNKVQRFIVDKGIMSVDAINEHWMTPLLEEKRMQKNWLRLASEEDKRLFAEAPHHVQEAIEESAKYVVIQNKRDADEFWDKTGLRQQKAMQIMNESLAAQYALQNKSQIESDRLSAQQAAALGYSMNYFKLLEDNY